MKRNNKILLITAGTMDYISGGTVMYRKLLEHIPTKQLCWAIAGGWSKKIPSWMSDREYLLCYSPLFNRLIYGLIRRIAFHRLVLHHIWFWYAYRWFPKQTAKKICKFARQQGVSKIWVHATGPTIGVAARLRRMLELPIHVNVQDDIDGTVGTREGNWLRKDFTELLQNATTCDVTCPSMKEYYIRNYNACQDALVFWNGSIFGDLPSLPHVNRNIRVIGIAGYIWSTDTVNICLAALNLLNEKRGSDRFIKLRVYSNRIRIKHSCLQYEGLLDPQNIISALQECDLLYVPMSFLPRYEVLCSTSLPGKMLSYMQAQVPLLAHGPEYASNIRFVREHGVGIVSTSTDPKALAMAIEKYERNFDLRIKASQRCRELSQTKFDPDRVWQRFQRVLFKE